MNESYQKLLIRVGTVERGLDNVVAVRVMQKRVHDVWVEQLGDKLSFDSDTGGANDLHPW